MKETYAGTYAAAMEAANAELDGLFEEAKRLRNRMEQIDTVIDALKPLMPAAEPSYGQDPGSSTTKQKIDSTLGLVFA